MYRNEWVIASDVFAAGHVAKLIESNNIPRIFKSEADAMAEYRSRGFMMARYGVFACKLIDGRWHVKRLDVSPERDGQYAQQLARMAGA